MQKPGWDVAHAETDHAPIDALVAVLRPFRMAVLAADRHIGQLDGVEIDGDVSIVPQFQRNATI